MSAIFDYEINIDFQKVNELLKEKIGTSWSVVEKFFLPESFVSNKGAFMFKVKEDEKNFIDTWLLVIPSNIKVLIKFLKGNITYNDFLSVEGNRFFILKWNLQKFNVCAEHELNLSEAKEYITYILDQTLLPDDTDKIEKIVKIFEAQYFMKKFMYLIKKSIYENQNIFFTTQESQITFTFETYAPFLYLYHKGFQKIEYSFKNIKSFKDEYFYNDAA